ncbi:MAG: TolC family protein [Candidatus Gastranaerophilales bacterium]|nr:TolC family protein [Candidatus Gastranaerophilales bacterium]
MGKFKKFLIIIIVMLFNILNVRAETISFDSVLNKALDNSFDLKASNINIDISKSFIKKTKSEYFPIVKTGLYTEYSQDMSKNNQTEAIGDTVITPNSKIQNMLNTSISYNIFDFGQRKRKLLIAKDDIEIKQSLYSIQRRDLKLKIIDLYANTLLAFKELMAKEQLEEISRNILQIKERQFNDGTGTKLETIDSSINVANINNEVENLKMNFISALRELSYFTNEAYNIDEVVVSDFEERNTIPVKDKRPALNSDKNVYQITVEKQESLKPEEVSLNLTYTPDYKNYQYKIDKKDKELELLRREKLPQIGMYVNYTLTGKDENSILNSFQDFQNRNVALGLSTTFVSFDGFKNAADKRKIKLEIKKLKLERDKTLAELKNKYAQLNESAAFSQRTYESNRYLLTLIADKLAELKRLAESQPENNETVLNEQSKLIVQQLEIEKKLINRAAIIKKNQIFIEEIE